MARTHVVFVGFKPGIYNSWSEAQRQVHEFTGAVHESFPTRAQAEQAFLDYWGESSQQVANRRSTHQWTATEDAILIDCCVDLVNHGGWSEDNGTFRAEYLTQLEKWMAEKIPNCVIKGNPHINSRMKTLKSQYREIANMLSNAASGFEWDDNKKCVTCELDVWVDWVKGHPGAVGLRNKSFLHFNKLALIFGKDRATGLVVAESPAQAVDNIKAKNADAKEAELEDLNLDSDAGENDGFTPYTPFSDPSVDTQRCSVFNADSNVTSTRNKKRKFRDSNMETLAGVLIDNMIGLRNLCERASQEVGKLADCFQFMADNAARRMKVMDLISELKDDVGLTEDDIVEITESILSNPTRVDVFFSCSNERRKLYVKKYLCQVHQLLDRGI